MRQILYVSLSTLPGDAADLSGILEQSRHNNAADGISGLLWYDGARFMQVLEGPASSVGATWARIQADDRHHAIECLHDRRIAKCEFGYWSMAHRRAGDLEDVFEERLRRLLATTSDEVGGAFLRQMALTGGADRDPRQ